MDTRLSLDVIDIAKLALGDYVSKYLFSHVRILFVVDESISLSPGANAFGVERVIRLLRESKVGCMHFHVDVGLRSPGAFNVVPAPTGTQARYLGFRFDSTLPDGTQVIKHYDEIFCFGFNPDNLNGPDSSITQASALPASDAELAVLTTWMNNKGGVFATGDHDYLGASMCHRIPRVSTMRAWTNAQGVPPIAGPQRIDTNRPANPAELAGLEVIEFERQSDTLPQTIAWTPWLSYRHHFHVHRRPHPVLCHPSLGPINVMPDHPHEGVVFDHVAQPDVGLAPITLTNTYNFGGVSGNEYPSAGGVQPLPMVIARGTTLADPPLQHEKGDSPAKRFGMISVYDGHRAGVGRVGVDSTWHHWMNINITGLEAAGGADWEKIKRYYLNLAVWLAPPHIARQCLHIHLLESFYSYPGIEEFNPKQNIFDLGNILRERLAAFYGPCWVTQFALDLATRVDTKLGERLIAKYLAVPTSKVPVPPRPEPCLTCPPIDAFEAALLGGVVRNTAEVLQGAGRGMAGGLKRLRELDESKMEEVVIGGATAGLKELQSQLTSSLRKTETLLGVN